MIENDLILKTVEIYACKTIFGLFSRLIKAKFNKCFEENFI